ncbi:MAG: site-specific integrase, partial [Actinomycetota bacterium]
MHREGGPESLFERSGTALELLAARAQEYVTAARAPATLRAYRSDWAEFSSWARDRDLVTLPAEPSTVALYLTDLAGLAKNSTLARRLASISAAHRAAGHPSPTDDPGVKAVWAGSRRTHGSVPDRAAPITVPLLRRMVDALPAGLGGLRDRALLLVGFAGALRRSELVALDVADVSERDEGLVIVLRRSKTDHEGAGREVGLPYGSNPATCPVRSLRVWVDMAGITAGPLFRPVDRHGKISDNRLSAAGANRIVQRAVARTGADPRLYSAHSLRAGLATAAAEAGVPERSIMNQTGHRSLVVARGYIRRGSLFR